MKCTIPEISWHNREPVLSVDLHPDVNSSYKLATGGGDSHVLIWVVNIEENGALKQEVISDLKRHQRSVNVVRWSPSGTYLASADDDANIIIWHMKTDNIPSLDDESNDKEVWIVLKILRGHKEDIYDLCWSPNSLKLLSGSIDNTAILWDMQKGKSEQIMTDHKGFVQGVAWDPKSQYIATISTDRVCRIFDTNGKHIKARISKGTLPVSPEHNLYEKEVKYFHDDTFKSFFRRLSFSPDGSILIVPSGLIVPDEGKSINCTYIFAVETNLPAAILPTVKQCSTVVRCCPIYFELREDGPEPYINLPYRILFAIGTDHDIILYDTQQKAPFARFNNIHYTRLTDLTWSSDGLLLIASSTDGFCTLITFEPEELGVQYVKEESETEDSTLNMSILEDKVNTTKTPEVQVAKVKEVQDKPVVKVLTPRRVKRQSVPEKNKSILSFFKKANDQKKVNEDTNDQNKNNPDPEPTEIEEPSAKKTKIDINCEKIEPEFTASKVEENSSTNLKSSTLAETNVESPYVKLERLDLNIVKKPRRITPSRVSELCSAVETLIKFTSEFIKTRDYQEHNCNSTISIVLNFNQVISCLEFLSKVIREEGQVNLELHECRKIGSNRLEFCLDLVEKTLISDETSNEFGQFLKWMDNALYHISEIDIEKQTVYTMLQSTKNIFEGILAHALSIAQICLDRDSTIIKGSCRTVLNSLTDLENELHKNEPNKAMISLFVKDCSNKLCLLERRVDIAVLKLSLFVFARYCKVLEKIHNFCEVNCKKHFDQEALKSIIADFDIQLDRIFQIGLFAVFCSSNIRSGINIKNCMASLESLEHELVPAMQMILRNGSTTQRISALILKNYWIAEANKLKVSVYEIIDPLAFCGVIHDEISSEIHRIVEDCDKNKDETVFDNIFNIGKVLVEFLLTVVRVEAIKDEQIKERIRKCNAITLEIGAGIDVLDGNNSISNGRLLKRCKILQSQVEKLLVLLKNQDEVRNDDVEGRKHDPTSDEEDETQNMLFSQIMCKGKEILQNRSIMYRTPKKLYQTFGDCNDDHPNSMESMMKKPAIPQMNFSFRSSDSLNQISFEKIFADLSKLTTSVSEK
ncbi:uncharacterized protein LOC123316005 [Coccinella septempunctata]|uniref:uncharacterized protein LOC123316005 n=1 Tax=Coccinella septempunctata TaxID=41139 RepID=UPI001D097A5E|nr:uncharacterized protein LOC123316005 [Coccinella septempunctata]